jgi:hypothetical protein
MRISHFFIDRPIFASVVSIIFVILGGVAFFRLPVAQYPEIAPPTITVSGQYPGASAEVVAATVVTPIEQQINASRTIYMSSNSTGDGRFYDFRQLRHRYQSRYCAGQVQNRVSIAQPRLPFDVRNIGVTVEQSSPDLMMIVHLYSPDNRAMRSSSQLRDYRNHGHDYTRRRCRLAHRFSAAATAMRLARSGPIAITWPHRQRRCPRTAGSECRLPRSAQPAAGGQNRVRSGFVRRLAGSRARKNWQYRYQADGKRRRQSERHRNGRTRGAGLFDEFLSRP